MTDLNAAVADSLAGILAINKNIEELVQEAKTKRLEAMEPFLEALAASGQVSVILVRGYTPGFNDGEPCEHSADFWVNFEQLQGNDFFEDYEDLDTYGIELPEDLEIQQVSKYDRAIGSYVDIAGAREHNRAEAARVGHVYDAPSADIMSAIQSLIYTTVDEEEGTDYWVSFVLEDGKFVKRSGEYECGY